MAVEKEWMSLMMEERLVDKGGRVSIYSKGEEVNKSSSCETGAGDEVDDPGMSGERMSSPLWMSGTKVKGEGEGEVLEVEGMSMFVEETRGRGEVTSYAKKREGDISRMIGKRGGKIVMSVTTLSSDEVVEGALGLGFCEVLRDDTSSDTRVGATPRGRKEGKDGIVGGEEEDGIKVEAGKGKLSMFATGIEDEELVSTFRVFAHLSRSPPFAAACNM